MGKRIIVFRALMHAAMIMKTRQLPNLAQSAIKSKRQSTPITAPKVA